MSPIPRTHSLFARGIRATLDLDLGQMADLCVSRWGRTLTPFARVPWADGPDDPARFGPQMPPHLRRMSGDFFCAPFATDDLDGAPPHGWTANGTWQLVAENRLEDGVEAHFRLDQQVAGAVVTKTWILRDDHPFLYQRHSFSGGTRPVPVAHHAMIDLRGGGHLRVSPKRHAETPPAPLEGPETGGRSVLSYPAQSTDLTRFPSENGLIDLTRYPLAEAHDDFVMLVDDPDVALGWATVVRPDQGDMAILLKPSAVLPQTMLWISNGGRDYPPWNGEHTGVLGIEEACSYGGSGWKRSITDNPLTDMGIPTALDLTAAPEVSVATAIGALPTTATKGLHLAAAAGGIRLSDGTQVLCDLDFLGL